ncbi:hypothetical protein SPHINGOT1_270018 [Sphingomonas sp. T1]|nr:hypothetical protein SPHINGOT1_270018 [Sphingomonas sp. T1]
MGMPTRRYVKIAAQNPPAADLQRLKLIQGSVGFAKRGATTASNLFARNLGSTVGAAVPGTVLDARLARGHAGAPQQI